MTKLSLLLPRRSESTPVFSSVRELLRQTELTSYGKILLTILPKGRKHAQYREATINTAKNTKNKQISTAPEIRYKLTLRRAKST